MQANNAQNEGRGGIGGKGGIGGRGGMGDRDNQGNRNHRTPDNATFDCRVTNGYCHNHDGCNHIFGDCTRPVLGHNNAAMMDNRLDGSNAFCQPHQE